MSTITWTTNGNNYFAKFGKSNATMHLDTKSNTWNWKVTRDHKFVCGGSGIHKHNVKATIEKELRDIEAKMDSPRFEVRRQYLLGNDEIKFIESLPRIGGDTPIEYTAAQKKQMQSICERIANMSGHTEWHWMLKGANTTNFKTTKANAMHIYLNGLKGLKSVLSPMEAAYEFHHALWMHHTWFQKLLHNAYTLCVE